MLFHLIQFDLIKKYGVVHFIFNTFQLITVLKINYNFLQINFNTHNYERLSEFYFK